MGCFSPILLMAMLVFLLVSLIRWFEQTSEAVDQRDWRRLLTLLIMPFSVWLFQSRVLAGRPTPVPKHEPVRGFGSVGKANVAPASGAKPQAEEPVVPTPVQPNDQPPPGTPAEFLGLPKIPPARPRSKSAADPELMEKLRKKMRDQGMLPPE